MDKEIEKINKTQEINKEIVDLVIARLKTIPSNATLSIGGEKDGFTVSNLIDRVRAGDEVGKKIIEAQLYFLRSLKDLPIEENASSHN